MNSRRFIVRPVPIRSQSLSGFLLKSKRADVASRDLLRPQARTAIERTILSGRAVVLVEDASGVDDDGLAGHGLGAAHGDDHVGAVVLVSRLLQECGRCG